MLFSLPGLGNDEHSKAPITGSPRELDGSCRGWVPATGCAPASWLKPEGSPTRRSPGPRLGRLALADLGEGLRRDVGEAGLPLLDFDFGARDVLGLAA